jgi:anthranilate synthase component 1
LATLAILGELIFANRFRDPRSPICRRSPNRHPGQRPRFLSSNRPAPARGQERNMTELEFQSLAVQGYNRIPLIAEAFADLETPLTLYLKLAQSQQAGKNSFLLESVVGGERFGRYSFIGLPAATLMRSYGERIEVVTNGVVSETHEGNPLEFIAAFQARYKVALRPGMPRFCGGLAGYFGYDAVRHIEKKLAGSAPKDDLGLPDIQLLVTEELAVIDNLSGKLYLIVYADTTKPEAYSKARQRLKDLRAMLRRAVEPPVMSASTRTETVRDFAKADYLAAVDRAKEYIMAGDLMQVQIGQRLRKPYVDSPLSLYRALRSLNPSPYMYFYNFGDMQVVGASPEILVRNETIAAPATAGAAAAGRRKVTIRPLAGTRPRGATPERDAELATELLADPKEIAEHVMLIDLARNDIGRIAETGTVEVTDKFAVEKYSHVQHIVSNVEGTLRAGLSNLDVLKATFPAGTLSGAPKVRAMEIIDELELTKRGIYGGAVGYLSFGGEMDLAIGIRTGVIKDGSLYVQAAAGIVADSVPEMEWQETENKARAVLRAAEQVQDGLDGEL